MSDQVIQLKEILAQYQKHGWRLEHALMRPDTRMEVLRQDTSLCAGVPIKEFLVDALWLSRSSQDGREAWELRLVASTPYALFETFEADETEEYREDVKADMEARLLFFSNAGDAS